MTTTAEVLRHGELSLEGRSAVASNLTLVGTATLDGRSVRCVYKPVSGEQPLWDFPDGTLAAREVAAYEVSAAMGWGIVPRTVLRDDGPLGAGMCQEWIEQSDAAAPWVDVVTPDRLGDGLLPVLEVLDGDGRPVVLAHRNVPALRRVAVFDVVVNNADRKGGHILHGPGLGGPGSDGAGSPGRPGTVLGIDHGVSFHVEPKLRTVLWGWAGSPLTREEQTTLRELRSALSGPLCRTLTGLLGPAEVAAIADRIDTLTGEGVLPWPSGRMPVPWPLL